MEGEGRKAKMKWKKSSLTILVLYSLITISTFSASVKATNEQGPRLDELSVYFYENGATCYAALKAGEIDLMIQRLSIEQYDDAIVDPNIVVGAQIDLGMREFDINSNYTVMSRPDHRSPTNDVNFRQALCYLTDKDYIVEEIWRGFAKRIDVPLPEPQSHWWNPNVTGSNYPYGFSIAQAQAVLDAGGWEDIDDDGIRNYPEGWHGKLGLPNLDPIIFMARVDDPLRTAAAEHLRDNMEAVGIPVHWNLTTRQACVDRVMVDKDYHIYTAGWGLGREPTIMFFLYHSRYWTTGAFNFNYVTGMDEHNEPNYPALDEALADVYYAETLEESSAAVMIAQEIFVENAINIPLLTTVDYRAWRSDLLGVVNMQYYGPENPYTFMNAYHENPANKELKMGIVAKPEKLNVICSDWLYEYQCLDRIIGFGRSMLPYDIYTDQPWMIEDWEVDTWDGGTKTKQTLWLNEDITFVKPVTGNHFSDLTAEDFFFSVWLFNAFDDGWYNNWMPTENIDHVVIVDDHCVEIYYSDLSYWFKYEFPPYCLPREAWDRENGFTGYNGRVYTDWPITDHLSESYVVGDSQLPETPGLLETTRKPVWVESITADGSPLERFTDWNIVQRNARPYIYIYADLLDGTTVSLDYSVSQDAWGTYPGECDWEDILVGNGMWYVTDIGTDWFKCKANREYFMEAPIVMTVETPVAGEMAVIEGNVTLSAANTTYNTIRLNVTGPTGSTGWINITFPAINTTEIRVFIDEVELTPPPFPIITTNGTHYFIYFEFTLSTHTLTIKFAPPAPPVGGFWVPINKTALIAPWIGLASLVTVAAASIVYVKRRKKQQEN